MQPEEAPCPDDAELAAFVERTLTADRLIAVEDHIDGCARCRETVGHVAATGADQPRKIGRYRLDRVIGSGGMGVVWQAWDPALERGLAIKLLLPEVTDDNGRARLVREARALARLQHPNVVAVHDVGELAGELFIATELIDGESLDRWQRGRPPGEVIAAYAQAARGLAAAHGLGLVHRDVKPSNILVGRDGRVRVGDFGLATRDLASAPTVPARGGAAAHEPRLTADGAVVGTPAYMAPEQRDGVAVDARADQYSLCLALAEALLGEQPAPDATATTLAQRGVVAPWPAIARGLSTSSANRFPTLAPLIDALDASGARPRSRRRPALIAGAAAAVAAAAVAIGLRATDRDPAAACADRTPLAGAWDASHRRAIIDAFTASKLPYADDAARAVVAAADGWANEFAVEDRRACEDAAVRRQPAEVVTRRRACLDRARGELVALVAGLTQAPDAGVIQRGPASARALASPPTCNTAAGLADQTIAPDAATAARVEALTTRVMKAWTLRHLDKLADARAEAEAVLVDARALGFLPTIALAQHELGHILHALDDPSAEQVLTDALAVAAEARADHRAAAIAAFLVEVVGVRGDIAAAERQARLARPAIIRAGTDRNLEAVVERGLGRASQAAKKYADAYDHYRRAEDIHVALGDTDAIDFDRRAQVTALGSLDRLDEAARINDQVLTSDLANLGAKHPRTIADRSWRGLLLFKAGRYADAATLLEQLIPIDEEVAGRDSNHVAGLRAQLAAAYMALGRLAEAETALTEIVRALATRLPADSAELRGQRMNLAGVQILLGHFAPAQAELTALAEAARAAKDDDMLGLILQNLAEALTRDGKHTAALAAAREAVDKDAAVFGPVSRRGGEAHASLGNAYVGLGRLELAIAEYKLAIHAFETTVGADTPQLGEPLTALGELALGRKNATAARPLIERAVALLAGGDPVDLARARFALARVLAAVNDRDAARIEANAAVELYGKAGERATTRKAEAERWLAELR